MIRYTVSVVTLGRYPGQTYRFRLWIRLRGFARPYSFQLGGYRIRAHARAEAARLRVTLSPEARGALGALWLMAVTPARRASAAEIQTALGVNSATAGRIRDIAPRAFGPGGLGARWAAVTIASAVSRHADMPAEAARVEG